MRLILSPSFAPFVLPGYYGYESRRFPFVPETAQ